MLNNMTQKEDLQNNKRPCNDYFRIQGLFFYVLILGAIISVLLHIYLNVFYVRTAIYLAGSKSKEIQQNATTERWLKTNLYNG